MKLIRVTQEDSGIPIYVNVDKIQIIGSRSAVVTNGAYIQLDTSEDGYVGVLEDVNSIIDLINS